MVALALAACAFPASAALTWQLAGGNESWPAAKRTAIINAMNQAVATYNANGYFSMTLTANYNASVPTAQASYGGWIDFGGSISTRVALHEFAHTQGCGTVSAWSSHNSSGTWNGVHATAREKVFDGATAVLHCDNAHFWPYGLNYDTEDSALNRVRHLKMVSALRWDMGLVSDSDSDGLPDDWERFYFGNLAQSGTDDTDRDGVSNLDEYNADTNPAQLTALVWKGGSGAWDTTTANWPSGTNVWRNALCDEASFGGVAGTVTAASGVQVNEMDFSTTGYQVSGSPLTLIGYTPTCWAGTNITSTIDAVLGGSGGLTKSGSGAVTLSGGTPNTYSGTTIVLAGTLALAKTPGVAAIPGNITIGDLSGSDVLLVTTNEQIADTAVVSFNAAGSGNSAFMRLNGGVTETVGGIKTVSPSQAPVIEPASAGVATLIVSNNAACTYDGIIRDRNGGTVALVKLGTNTLTLNNTAGVAGMNFAGGVTVGDGTLTLSSMNGATGSQLVINTFASAITNNDTLAFDNDAGLVETFSKVISGSGALIKTGDGQVTLNQSNRYAGGTVVGFSNGGSVGGILRASHSAALGVGNVTVVAGDASSTGQGAQLQFSGGITVTNPLLSISGQGYGTSNGVRLNVSGTNTFTGAIHLISGAGGSIIGSDAGTLVLSGTISAGTTTRTLEFTGAGNIDVPGVLANGTTAGLPVTKSGAGRLTLSATNTYTGETTITDGVLLVKGWSGTGALTLTKDAWLGGAGVIRGPVTTWPGTTFAPGTGLGTLTISNSLTLGGNLAVEINRSVAPQSDSCVVTGTLTNSGTGTLTLTNLGPALVAGDKFTLFSRPLLNGNSLTVVPPPGVRLANQLAVDGSLVVLPDVNPTNIHISLNGGTLNLSWPADHVGWRLQCQSNPLSVGLGTNWVPVPASNTTNHMSLPAAAANGTVLYRLVFP